MTDPYVIESEANDDVNSDVSVKIKKPKPMIMAANGNPIYNQSGDSTLERILLSCTLLLSIIHVSRFRISPFLFNVIIISTTHT